MTKAKVKIKFNVVQYTPETGYIETKPLEYDFIADRFSFNHFATSFNVAELIDWNFANDFQIFPFCRDVSAEQLKTCPREVVDANNETVLAETTGHLIYAMDKVNLRSVVSVRMRNGMVAKMDDPNPTFLEPLEFIDKNPELFEFAKPVIPSATDNASEIRGASILVDETKLFPQHFNLKTLRGQSPIARAMPLLMDMKKLASTQIKNLERGFDPTRGRKIGANEKCPCGSGKKYKKCCRDK